MSTGARACIAIVACLLAAAASRAQVDTLLIPLRHLSIEDGLSQGMVGSILQDRAGFMWFATKDGLNRYDGYSFKVFRHDPQDSSSVRDNHILKIFEDSKGLLWIGTNSGLDVFDPATEVFHHLPRMEGTSQDGGDLVCDVRSIAEDPSGNIWFNTAFNLYRVRPGTTAAAPLGPGTHAQRIADIHNCGLFVDHAGILRSHGPNVLDRTYPDRPYLHIDTRDEPFIASLVRDVADRTVHPVLGLRNERIVELAVRDAHRRITYQVAGTGTVTEIDDATGHERVIPAGQPAWGWPKHGMADVDGRIWLATDQGLWRCDPSTGRSSAMRPIDGPLGMTTLDVACIHQDRSGVIWIGTPGYGIFIYDPRIERFHTQLMRSVGWMAPLSDGRVLLVSGLNVKVCDPHRSITTPAPPGLVEGSERQFYYDRTGSFVVSPNGTVWSNANGILARSATDDRDFRFFRDPAIPVEFPLYASGDTLVAFGSASSHGLFDTRSERFTSVPYPMEASGGEYRFVQATQRDAAGIFWLGTMKGLLRLDPRTNAWQHYQNIPSDTTSLAADVIFCLLGDPKDADILWVGTSGGGLARLDKRTGRCRRFSTRDGLPNNVIYGLLSDDDGQLWMSTNKGLCCFDPETYAVRNFDGRHGLQNDEFNRYAFCKTQDGTLFFGGVNGLNHFHPRDLRIDERPVQVAITDIKLSNRSIALGAPEALLKVPTHLAEELVIPYAEASMLSIDFASMEYIALGNRTYQYQLEGYDRQRIDAGQAHSANYTNLDPGDYTFKVWGRNRDGVWNAEPIALRITILPPWYLTIWAKVAAVLILAGAVLLFIRIRTGGLKKQKELLERTVAERTAELSQAKDRAERSEVVKQQFLANMSHEIRTPMNAIMGMTGILKRNEHLPEQEKYLNAVSQSSENLLVILNDILDLSKLEAGRTELEQVAFDPRQVIGNVRDILRYKAEEKGLALVVEVDGDLPGMLLGDPTRLNQIVLNLAGNAIKFTERGSVTLRARWVNGELRIDVIDTGIGIPQDRLYTIFEEFTQAYSDTARKYGGTGLGLTISKRLAEMQGGSITVKSEQGRGSTFTLTIPYSIASATPATTAPDPGVEGKELRNVRILLAEDNDFNAMVAQDELADAIPGVRVDVAVNGSIALEMVRANDYDVILMDVQMPEMNGYDATRAIRALKGNKSRIPIVAMTANVMKEEVERCKEAGMDGYVPKPFKREELIGALQAALHTSQT
ncbi:MAG: response regulator [Flavobacteriales bacterium]|jgi:signal transduction histidine kinase/CheY-like chemotaxis protein/ligand-binding sensor domain-containing protein|nr:response regulator [Flavobacteriales bacterium]